MMRSRGCACLVRFSQPTVGCSGMAAPHPPTQAGQPVRVYPLKWMESVFDSREKAECLLKPEVENGNVSYHDMELAQVSNILLVTTYRRNNTIVFSTVLLWEQETPSSGGSHSLETAPWCTRSISRLIQLAQLIYSSLAFLGAVAYSQGFARPKWRLSKLVATSTLLGFCSYSIGFNQKLSAHIKFARSLDNPAGFNQALRNINARLGGPEHFPYGVPERREEVLGAALGPPVATSSTITGSIPETTEPTEGWAVSPFQEEPDQNQGEYPYVMIPCVIPGPPASTNAQGANQLYIRFDPAHFGSLQCSLLIQYIGP